MKRLAAATTSQVLVLILLQASSTHATTTHTLFTSTGSTPDGRLGQSVATAGDFNADGYPDLIAGEPNPNLGNGSAYVFFGGSGRTPRPTSP
jgi:hypothetical protein